MPSTVPGPSRVPSSFNEWDGAETAESINDASSHVNPSQQDEKALAALHWTLTREGESHYAEPHSSLDKYLRDWRPREESGKSLGRLGVCFKNVTTWAERNNHLNKKTLGDALWRTLTFQDIYELTFKKWLSSRKLEEGRPLIRDFSGVVRSGEILLVLGRPGAGCSTFLKTIANNQSSFLGVTGSIDYSGLSPAEVSNHYCGEVAYIPEDDVHHPTLTVRQTIEFALESKTPKKFRDRIPEILDLYGRVLGMSHVMDTLVGNEYIRGISGGERKRVSIIESLAADPAVVAWDNSTRGLDAAAAVDYFRSLRIMTDTCGKATIVTVYQASDTIYNLADKVLIIDEGRMLYQGPAQEAKSYFENLGYECQPGQTIADFLTGVTSPEKRVFRKGYEGRAPRGAVELEKAFRESQAFKRIQQDIHEYEAELGCGDDEEGSVEKKSNTVLEGFKTFTRSKKSRFVSKKSPYNTSLTRQVLLCTRRQWWQLKGYPIPLYMKLITTVICALLVASMFYDMPTTTTGAFARGGFIFYSVVLVVWIQLAEVEDAVQGREIVSRQKRFAFVRPSAVTLARVLIDLVVVLALTILYCIIAYFMAGLKMEAGPFFVFFLFMYITTVCYTSLFRVFAAISPSFEVALRYCGVTLLIAIVYSGYLVPLDKLIADVPWVGWLAYTTPVLYAYEACMAIEFRNLDLQCDTTSIVPSGPNYTDVRYQSCSAAGSEPGLLTVNGDAYLENNYGFHFNNIWRDFGIIMLFTVAFIVMSSWLTEVIEWNEGATGAVQYRRKCRIQKLARHDEENNSQDIDPSASLATAKAPPGSPAGRQQIQKMESSFTWRALNYRIKTSEGERVLLNDVTGYCEPGQLTALVGSSGAGKSTLLTILTQRQRTGRVTGDLMVGGTPVDETFRRRIGYCQQMDIHDGTSTIREAFEFSALLRQDAEIPRQEKLDYVDTILDTLELTELQDAVIDSLPLEQKRRTTIGVELCARPNLLLFLDEPTSGLDSQGALSIVSLLRKLADAGQAIICTIHQASQQQIELFDRVLALNPGGNVYYFGPVGPRGKAVCDYFSNHGVIIEDGKNVADLLIEVGVGVAKIADQEADPDWNEIWKASPEARRVEEKVERICSSQADTNPTKCSDPVSDTVYAASTWTQIVELTKRTSRQYWRTPEYPYSRLYASVLHALLNGLTYLQIGNSLTDMQLRSFSCFLILMIVPEFVNATAMKFIENRDIWQEREYPSRIYGWVAFTTAQIVAELPYAFIGGVIFYLLFYFPVGLPLGTPAGYTFLMVIFFHLFATAWGQWIAAMSIDSVMAANMMPFFVIMCELFNGVLRHQEDMPVFWAYTMHYITPFTYWIGGILSMILTGQEVTCEPSEMVTFEAPPSLTCGEYARSFLESNAGYLANPDAVGSCQYCPYSVGDDYLAENNLGLSKRWRYFGIFAGFVISNYLMIYLLVYIFSAKKSFKLFRKK
ncbi:hypothetical protein VTO42DRAFT_8139 [Malbranchea cinnamomea]